jgi:hypothetical protein
MARTHHQTGYTSFSTQEQRGSTLAKLLRKGYFAAADRSRSVTSVVFPRLTVTARVQFDHRPFA